MYRIVPDQATMQQVAALPAEALDAYAELLAVLELSPWNGPPHHGDNPEGAVRHWTFGRAGEVVYLILEDQREVHLLLVLWMG